MANESDAREAEETNQVGTSGDVDIGDSARAEDPQIEPHATTFAGRFLRFAGMTIIVAVILLAVFFWQEPVLFIGLLVMGMAGAAMHYKGRKLAPGKPGASILGGLLGGVASTAALIIGTLFVVAMFLDGCRAFFKL